MYPRANPFANPAPQQQGLNQHPPPPSAQVPEYGGYGTSGSQYSGAQGYNQAPFSNSQAGYGQAAQNQGGYAQISPSPYAGQYQQPAQFAPQAPAPTVGGAGSSYRYASHPDVMSSRGGALSPGLPHVDASLEASLRDSDEFNAPLHFVRGSYSRLPSSAAMGSKIRGPMGFVFQPLAAAPEGHREPPTVNFSTVGSIVRCRRCRTYINPFVMWEASGRRWTCNLCGFSNETLNTYFGPLDSSGKRADRYEHAELCSGSVDYIAPAEYMVRPPQPPAFLFLLDVTSTSVNAGMLDVACGTIRQMITEKRFPGIDRCQIGIMTFDTSIQFFNLNASLKNPQMIVVNDFEEMFVPIAEEVMVPLRENEASVLALLDALPQMNRSNKAAESCLGSAVRAASLAMKHVGGKLIICASTIPSLGELGLTSRKDNAKLLNTEREIDLLKPSVEGYKELATELTKVQICCEIFVGTSMYMDLASIAPLAKLTAGDIRYYPGFSAGILGEKFRQELMHVCTRSMGWEAVMRVRVSRGWKISKFFGHLYVRGVDLLVVPNCHADQTFGIVVEPVENETPDPNICVQFALLYTNSEAERRIRVHTIQAVSTPNVAEVYATLDPEVMASLIANLAMEESIKTTMSSGRNLVHTTCQQIASAAGPGNEAVANLAMLCLGLLKSGIFRATNDVLPDLRIYYWLRFESIPLALQAAVMYPRMFALHATSTSSPAADDAGLPAQLPLSVDQLTQDGVVLIEDGEQMLMWIGTAVSPDVVSSLFQVQSVELLNLESAEQAILTSQNSLGQKVASILAQLRLQRLPQYMALQILPHEHPFSGRFFQCLVEDRTAGLQMTYPEFLQRIGVQLGNAPAPPSAPPSLGAGLLPPSYR